MSDKRTVRSQFVAAMALGIFLMSCGQKPDATLPLAQNPSSDIQAPGTEEQINEDLFTDVSLEEAQAVDTAQGVEDDTATTLKRRVVKVNFAPLQKQANKLQDGQSKKVFIRLPLQVFNDEKLDLVLDQVERLSKDNFIFTGQVSGDMDSGVTLVVNKGALVANIRRSDETQSYEVRYAGQGLHAVNLKADEEETNCPAVADHDAEEDAATEVGDTAQATGTISILGAYTPNARIKHGGTSGIVGLIQLGVADTNRALADSGSASRVVLAGTMEVERNESGNFSNDLGYLKSKTDSRWNGVHSKRAALRADQVTLVATYPYNSGTNGIGYIRAGFEKAFTVVKSSSFGVYTFAHELGHNLGLNHSDGYVNSSGRFRTILAYGSYTRIRRFSNPNVTYNGYRTGDSSHNEISIINSRSHILAGFY